MDFTIKHVLITYLLKTQNRRYEDDRYVTEWLRSQLDNSKSLVNTKLEEIRVKSLPNLMRNILEFFPKEMTDSERIEKLSVTITQLKVEMTRKTSQICNNVSDSESREESHKSKTSEKELTK